VFSRLLQWLNLHHDVCICVASLITTEIFSVASELSNEKFNLKLKISSNRYIYFVISANGEL
jgi:hypothetical protein